MTISEYRDTFTEPILQRVRYRLHSDCNTTLIGIIADL